MVGPTQRGLFLLEAVPPSTQTCHSCQGLSRTQSCVAGSEQVLPWGSQLLLSLLTAQHNTDKRLDSRHEAVGGSARCEKAALRWKHSCKHSRVRRPPPSPLQGHQTLSLGKHSKLPWHSGDPSTGRAPLAHTSRPGLGHWVPRCTQSSPRGCCPGSGGRGWKGRGGLPRVLWFPAARTNLMPPSHGKPCHPAWAGRALTLCLSGSTKRMPK